MEELTPRQQQVFDFLARYMKRQGYPPTLREICAELGTSGNVSAINHLEALERKGYITREAGSSRGIALKSDPQPDLVNIPIVGTVNAGQPALAFEDIEGYYPFERELASGGTFFLRVRGDSMIEDAILEGDLVLVRAQPTLKNGDVGVVMVNSEVTLKRFYLERGHVRLQPANRRMKAIIVLPDQELVIIGKVVKVLRELD